MKRAATLLAAAALLAACGGNTSGAPAPSIDSFSAQPATIGKGASSTLSWSVRNATQVSIDQGIGQVHGSSAIVTPAGTTTYTLTASGAGGSTTAKATVIVSGSASAPVITFFTANPSSVAKGTQTTLSWSVTGANSISIAPGVGVVGGTQTLVAI